MFVSAKKRASTAIHQEAREQGVVSSKLLWIFLGTCLFGCVTVEETYVPDGSRDFAIDCSEVGVFLKRYDCQRKAREICGGRGYEVMSVNNASVVGGGDGTLDVVTDWEEPQSLVMTVRCREVEPSEPNDKKKWRKVG
jgi:hypothetical protein